MQDPFAEKTIYNDGPIDKLFIKLFTQKMADQLEGESRLLIQQQPLAVTGHQSMASAAVARLAAWHSRLQPSVGCPRCSTALQHCPEFLLTSRAAVRTSGWARGFGSIPHQQS
jgi:hypothetical protein